MTAKRHMSIVLFAALLCLAAMPALAQTTTSKQEGPWHDPGTWDSGVPNNGINAVIRAEDVVWLGATGAEARTVTVHGTLTTHSNYTLTAAEGMSISAGGLLRMASTGLLTVTAGGLANNGDILRTASGGLTISAGDFTNNGSYSHTSTGALTVSLGDFIHSGTLWNSTHSSASTVVTAGDFNPTADMLHLGGITIGTGNLTIPVGVTFDRGAGTGSILLSNGNFLNNGSYQHIGTGSLTISAGNFTHAGTGWTSSNNSANIAVSNGVFSLIEDMLHNGGISIAANGLTIPAGVTLTRAGTGAITISAGDFINNGNYAHTGTGLLTINAGSFVHAGTQWSSTNSSANIVLTNGGFNFTSDMTHNGGITIRMGGLTIPAGVTFTRAGTGLITVQDGDFINEGNYRHSSSGNLTVSAGNFYQLGTECSSTDGGGLITVSNGSFIVGTDMHHDGGATVRNDFVIADTATLYRNGTGTITVQTGNFVNNGGYVQTGTGNLTISNSDFLHAGTLWNSTNSSAVITVSNGRFLFTEDMTHAGGITLMVGNFTLPAGRTLTRTGTGIITVQNGNFVNDGNYVLEANGRITVSTGNFINSATGMMDDRGNAGNISIFGDLRNEQNDPDKINLDATRVTFIGMLPSRVLSVLSPLPLGAMTIDKADTKTTVLLDTDVTLNNDISNALTVTTGTLITNGKNLTVNGGGTAGIAGSSALTGILQVTGNSRLVTRNINQNRSLGRFEVGPNPGDNPVVYILGQHNIGTRYTCTFHLWRGTVNYEGTGTGTGSSLYLTGYRGGDGGWYAYGGTANFKGSIYYNHGTSAAVFARFIAQSPASVRFVGPDASTITLVGYDRSAEVVLEWEFGDLVIDKDEEDVAVNFTDKLRRFSWTGWVKANSVTVNSGQLNLGGRFSGPAGYEFDAVTINGGTVAPTLTGDVLGNHIIVNDILTVNDGRFIINDRSLILGRENSPAAVNINGGRLYAVRENADTRIIARSANRPYTFAVNPGGTLAARNSHFSGFAASGIEIKSGGMVAEPYNLDGCTFENGIVTGPLLVIDNSQDLIINVPVLNGTDGEDISIRKAVDQGRVTIIGATGSLPGEANEHDPYDRIYWLTQVVQDVAAELILEPVGTVFEDSVFTPRAVVKNLGNRTEHFPAMFNIGNAYSDTVAVTLAPGAEDTLTFADWTAGPVGNHVASCSTMLDGDRNPGNDRATAMVEVIKYIEDVAATAILAPLGEIVRETVVTPRAVVRSHSTVPVNFPVVFRIADVYADTQQVTLTPGAEDTLTFADWTAGPVGSHVVSCSTMLAGDMTPGNDKVVDSIQVVEIVRDVAATKIIGATGMVYYDSTITPRAIVKSFSNVSVNFPVVFRIGNVYSDTQQVTLAPGAEDTLRFSDWTAGPVGWHAVVCSTMLAGDQNPGNDAVRDSIEVIEDVGIAEEDLPLTLEISRVAPNPLARLGSIRLGLPVAERVSIKLYDAVGRQVRVLADGPMPAGRHTLPIDATGLAEGVYLLKAETGVLNRTQKLVVQR